MYISKTIDNVVITYHKKTFKVIYARCNLSNKFIKHVIATSLIKRSMTNKFNASYALFSCILSLIIGMFCASVNLTNLINQMVNI